MTVRKIITEPDPILRKKCEALQEVDDSLRRLIKDMIETMYKAPGIGLAAIQLGISFLEPLIMRLIRLICYTIIVLALLV